MNYRVVIRRRLADHIHTVAFLATELGGDGLALTRAADEIILALSDNPAELGESREGSERVIIVHPLTAIYEVFEPEKVVMVYEGVYYPRRQL